MNNVFLNISFRIPKDKAKMVFQWKYEVLWKFGWDLEILKFFRNILVHERNIPNYWRQGKEAIVW